MHRAANSKVIQNTFVAEEGKDKKKARLSWYHPDDTVSACPQPMLRQHQHVLLTQTHALSRHGCCALRCGIPVLGE